MSPLHFIVCHDQNNGIGKNNRMLWSLPSEMKEFRNITIKKKSLSAKKNQILMGRKTWESLPQKPLQDRVNIVLTRNRNYQTAHDEVSFFLSPEHFFNSHLFSNDSTTFVIGGEQIYKLLWKPNTKGFLYATEIFQTFDCDSFFPSYQKEIGKSLFLEKEWPLQRENGISFQRRRYKF